MNRHKKWGIIALVICIIGGIVMFSLNHPSGKIFENKLTLTKTQQDNVVKWIARNYDFNKIKFNKFNKDKKTGSYHLLFELDDEYHTGVTIREIDEFNDEEKSVVLGPIEKFRAIEKNHVIAEKGNVSIDDIQVQYLGE